MTLKKLLLAMLFSAAGLTLVFAQGRPTSSEELIKTGVSFYSEGKYSEAVSILQLASSSSEALYWLSLSELSSGNFDKALSCLERLEKNDPKGRWGTEVPYHRGRCFYYLGRHEEAIASFRVFADTLSASDPRKASSYYWQGESLLALGQLDSAANAFSAVVEKYPNSSKHEAAYYRLNIINQKKIEAELLAILKWSHEESLKSMEEYQEREKNYELAIAAYQKRLGDLLALSGEGALGFAAAESPEYYQQRIIASDQRIAELEADLAEANAALFILRGGTDLRPLENAERNSKLEELVNAARELGDILQLRLDGVER